MFDIFRRIVYWDDEDIKKFGIIIGFTDVDYLMVTTKDITEKVHYRETRQLNIIEFLFMTHRFPKMIDVIIPK